VLKSDLAPLGRKKIVQLFVKAEACAWHAMTCRYSFMLHNGSRPVDL
jgi:hypothetical protein